MLMEYAHVYDRLPLRDVASIRTRTVREDGIDQRKHYIFTFTSHSHGLDMR